MNTDYPAFFSAAQGYAPYGYQERFATQPELPELLRAPTGAGKTATAALGWWWRRKYAPAAIRDSTPRRLVFCLPMRSLVSQTATAMETWRANLGNAGYDADVGVHVLLGGAVDQSWEIEPDKDVVLIGTQDQLLSRALNRGYAMSRYRWSVHFALLNNDALWVMDEVQLMGVGLSTSAQLQGFALPTFGRRQTVWMSATLDEAKLATVDHQGERSSFALTQAERAEPPLQKRADATKRLHVLEGVFEKRAEDYAKKLADVVVDRHRTNGGRTLVVVNQVDRAVALVDRLRKVAKDIDSYVLHSRFRPHERRAVEHEALKQDDAILVATQAIEAGVDITSRTLFAELASWSSMVQRFGRCNRGGECTDGADIYWIDLPDDAKVAAPYGTDDFAVARLLLAQVPGQDARPSGLPVDPGPHRPASPVLRRKDLLDLFDTTSDLSGFDVDVGRFVRDSGASDVQVAWRSWEGGGNDKAPVGDARNVLRPEELCRVAKHRFEKQYERKPWWVWDPLAKARGSKKRGDWVRTNHVKAGDTILLPVEQGGYHNDAADLARSLGFTGDRKHRPGDVPAPTEASSTDQEPESDEGEPDSMISEDYTVSLQEHSRDVRAHAVKLHQALGGVDVPWDRVVKAAHWHDLGKVHPTWQLMITSNMDVAPGPWAKRPKSEPPPNRIERRYYRHELASALAYLAHPEPDDLVAFLIAAHHGKVRTAIRSRPNEAPKGEVLSSLGLSGEVRLALGVYGGEPLPAADLGDGLRTQEVTLDLSVMDLGGSGVPSWVERVDGLVNTWGPFRLAFLETLVRVADWRASSNPAFFSPWKGTRDV